VTSRIRSAAAALLFLVCLVTLTSAFNLPNRSPDLSSRLASLRTATKPVQQHTTLTLADRVAYQRAIEEVYWRHRIWPKERPDPKPSLDEVMPSAQLGKKVEEYLRDSQALEDYWQQPVSAEQLQAEMDRMAKHTKQPDVLRELFGALGNDPFVIAECLARPVLAERTLATGASIKKLPVARREAQVPVTMAAASANYTLPAIASPSAGCIDDTWTPTSTASAPDARAYHTAVWTGSEMIVWGGSPGSPFLNTGGRYDPTTDSWTATSTIGAPEARWQHTAVWTGSEMIVWGGGSNTGTFNTGGRYNPSTDSWTPTSTTNAPTARRFHTAVWTDNEMIIWGGSGNSGLLNTGGRYNPATDSWIATSTVDAPSGRYLHTAVWTGSEMIVWGGATSGPPYVLNTGGRYNPGTDTWTATGTTNAPAAREYHTAVWTGSQMIVWGGIDTSGDLYTGGRYNPGADTWTPTSTTSAPQPRNNHTAVWTGSQMIVWGGVGCQGYFNTGGRYCAGILGPPPTPTATATPIGGCTNDTWAATSTVNAPDPRESHTAVWTGSEMIIWGGEGANSTLLNTGGRYNPATDSWTTTSTANTPTARTRHTAVWTGSEMIVWGGNSSTTELNTGGRYNPTDDSWTATSTANAPTARQNHTAVWSGAEMIVWGGYGCGGNCTFISGGRYNASTDTWLATSTTNAPVARWDHTAVWTGSEMIVWGGADGIVNHTYLHTGGRYNPASDSWMPTSLMNVPLGRIAHTAVWTGSEMIVWGGVGETFNDTDTGGRYNPSTDGWTATSLADAPSARDSHTAVWMGSQMIVWGGYIPSCDVRNSGARYEPITDSWTPTNTSNPPLAREYHTAVWTGSQMIVWGGEDLTSILLNTGGRYCAQPSTPIVQSAVSRKTHGSAGSFDIALPLTGTAGIECRTGGATNDYTLVITFNANVSVNANPQAAVTSGIGMVGTGGMSNGGMVTIAGNVVTVPLTSVANVQTINVTLFDVNGSTNVVIPMSILIGDTNANGTVNASDVSLTKSRVGQSVSGSNFREDVNANGLINSVDVALVKSKVGTALPP